MPLGSLLLFGNDQPANPGASVVTLYCSDGIVSGGNAGTLQTTVPVVSTSTTGWTVGTVAVGNYSRQSYNNEVATAGFGATAQPTGSPINQAQDCWRYGPSSGTFSGDTWYSSLSVIGVTSGGDQDGRARFRLWRSNNGDGTVATDIVPGTFLGTTVTNLSTTVAQSSSASIFVPTLTLVNEYLFLQAAWEISGVGAAVDRDVLVRYGSMSATDGSGLVTAPFANALAGGAVGAGLLPFYYRTMLADD